MRATTSQPRSESKIQGSMKGLLESRQNAVIRPGTVPGANIRKRAQPVEARIGTELDEYDLSEQGRGRQRWRIEPLRRTAESRDVAWLAFIRLGCADQAESRGRERHRRPAKKVPAAMIRSPSHIIALRRPFAKDGHDVHRFAYSVKTKSPAFAPPVWHLWHPRANEGLVVDGLKVRFGS